MARRNLLRSLLAASLLFVPFSATLLAVPAPAGGAEGEQKQDEVHWIRLSEKSGFNPGVVDARVGDFLAFILDDESVSTEHSVTFDDPSACPAGPGGLCWPELRFNEKVHECTYKGFPLPNTRCVEIRQAGPVRYHDRLYKAAGGPEFQGLIRVEGQPPTTTTTLAPTTTTTAAPAVTTTTRPGTSTTMPPTTNTTAPTTIRPFVISETTTTTAAPAGGGASTAGSGQSGSGTTAGAKGKDKGKGKADPSTTTTTVAPPAPETPDLTLFFEPVSLPESAGSPDATDGAEVESAAVMDLLNPDDEEVGGDDDRFALLAMGAAGLLVVGAGVLTWFRRSSRYFPA